LRGGLLGPKGEEVTGWRKLYKEELHNFYSTRYCCSDEIQEDEMRQNKFVEALIFLADIQKVFDLNLSRGTDYHFHSVNI
jgi:hypothetical protein